MKKYLSVLCTLLLSFPLIASDDKEYISLSYMENKLELGDSISEFELKFSDLDFDVTLVEEKQNEDFNIFELYNENIKVYYYAKHKKIFFI